MQVAPENYETGSFYLGSECRYPAWTERGVAGSYPILSYRAPGPRNASAASA